MNHEMRLPKDLTRSDLTSDQTEPIQSMLCTMCTNVSFIFFFSFVFMRITILLALVFCVLLIQKHVNTYRICMHKHIRMNFRPLFVMGKRYGWLKSKLNDCRNKNAFLSLKFYKKKKYNSIETWTFCPFVNVAIFLIFFFRDFKQFSMENIYALDKAMKNKIWHMMCEFSI